MDEISYQVSQCKIDAAKNDCQARRATYIRTDPSICNLSFLPFFMNKPFGQCIGPALPRFVDAIMNNSPYWCVEFTMFAVTHG
jgi:hypothetical protein